MAKLVGVYAASHGPLIVRNWKEVRPADQQSVTAAFSELGRRVNAARPDVMIVISPDHWTNFFINNLPSICVGVGEVNEGPNEPWLKEFPHREIPGHPRLAEHILNTALARDFDPSVSHRLILDHGFCIPLWKAGIEPLPALVPIILNDIEPPFPTVKRCYALGEMLAEAIASYPEDLRVAVMGTGGLSHSIGEPTMGMVEEEFDRDCLGLFESGDKRPLIEFLTKRLPTVGNGASEIRNWIAAHGAAGGSGFELINYKAIPELYVGFGVASWKLAPPATRRKSAKSKTRINRR
jgi:aromatic ring-opening dioxygenase catalytic subunit (LigB family)